MIVSIQKDTKNFIFLLEISIHTIVQFCIIICGLNHLQYDIYIPYQPL